MAQICDNCGRTGLPTARQMEGEYEQPLNFRMFGSPEAMLLVLSSLKATFFTAVVTAFFLDAIAEFKTMSLFDSSEF